MKCTHTYQCLWYTNDLLYIVNTKYVLISCVVCGPTVVLYSKIMTSVFITRTYLIFTCSKIKIFWSLNLWENIWKLLIGLRKFIVSHISSLFRDWNQLMCRDIVLSNNCRLSLLVCSLKLRNFDMPWTTWSLNAAHVFWPKAIFSSNGLYMWWLKT